jgi:hypothetical protein
MADQKLGRRKVCPEVVGCRHEVGDVRREVLVLELSRARAEAREVKAQHRDPMIR